ncbi:MULTISPECIES: Uma2 family endonuclease [unclassified Methylobacterium]|uniref:Uma2 family endonuclease n=1 Tax=unclassified Methylobacterium TaxID=2615210 RepID=UPI002269BE8C|nr:MULTISPECIES: Uma2 family endonuclease [unclassified Methylobacterium]
MTVDEFLLWANGQPERYELLNGEAFAMSPEQARHSVVKYATHAVLNRAIETAGFSCHMIPDRMTVRIDVRTTFAPAALVYCGPLIDPNAVKVANPVIVVEVLSPSGASIDSQLKLPCYFSLATLAHYLIIDPMSRLVIHHRRCAEELIETRIATEGTLDLTPPGLTLPVAELFADLPPPADPAA